MSNTYRKKKYHHKHGPTLGVGKHLKAAGNYSVPVAMMLAGAICRAIAEQEDDEIYHEEEAAPAESEEE